MFEQVSVTREIVGQGSNLLLCADGSAPLNGVLAGYAGQAQCVYIDPPFMTGDSFTRRRRFGQSGWKKGTPAPEYPAYADMYDTRESYLAFLRGLIENAQQLLNNTGMLALHLDWRTSAYGRILCDEVFGEDLFLNEIIWSYESGGRAKKYFSRKHDTILLYARSKDYRFDLRRVPLERTEHRKNHMRRRVDENGRAYSEIKTGGKVYRYYDDAPVYPGDVWTDISHLQQRDPERTGYATQKPVKLLDRILRPVVKDGDLVIDLCCGSGTAMAAAQALNCRFVGVDTAPEALLTTASRLECESLTLDCPCTEDETRLEGMYTGEGGMLLLTGFNATHPSFPKTEQAMDTLESWSAGRITPAGFVVDQTFRRTPKNPELPMFCILPVGEGEPGVATVDAAGRRRVYRWKFD
ncbi:MAG: site-specific DNA-methyltransferase [Clostridiales bacterium]|nr:site-specific DNA-methyltransferase [Clostridiales bacterium]